MVGFIYRLMWQCKVCQGHHTSSLISPPEAREMSGHGESISNRQKREAGVLRGACRSCREFFGSAKTGAVIKIKPLESVTYRRTCRDLEISKAAGCVLCNAFVGIDAVRRAQIYRQWRRQEGDSNCRLDEREYDISNFTGQYLRESSFVVHGDWGSWDYGLQYTMELHITASADDPAAEMYSRRPANRDVGSPRAFKWIAEKLNDCRTKHNHSELDSTPSVPKACESFDSSLPTRLIKVEHATISPTVRLVETVGQVASYVALSYCWGGAQEHATTTTNIQEYMQEIPHHSIPDTISDAIHVTKKLGFKYLWVDSYCILQDDDSDMIKELPRMSSIYQNAAITICAASARSCEDGFLGDRIKTTKRALETRCTIPLKNEYGEPAGSVHLEVELHRAAPAHLNLDNEPLNKRAWSLQETILSPRKLYYGEERLIWSCEAGIEPDGGTLTYADRGIWVSISNSPDPDRGAVLEGWLEAVEMFSRRTLTVGDDKFPAISAIAAEVQYRTGWNYAAGLWLQAMLHCLGWARAKDTEPSAQCIAKWRAPSWSWASLDEAVKYIKTTPFTMELSLPVNVVDCAVTVLHEQHPLGQIQYAELVVQGPLSPIIFHDHAKISIANTMFEEDFDRAVYSSIGTWTIDREMPMYDLYPPALHRKFISSKKKRLSGFLRSGRRDIVADGDRHGCNAWCLALWFTFFSEKDSPEDYYATAGLVLMKTSGNRYQRIGSFLGPRCNADFDDFERKCAFTMAPVAKVTII